MKRLKKNNEKTMKKGSEKSCLNISFYKRQRKSFAIFLFLLITTSIFAQNKTIVTGLVVDSKQEPLIGAAIRLKQNTSIATITDVNGKFSLAIPAGNQTLIVSYLGMTTREVPLNGKTNITINLSESNTQLDEVVIVGFGHQKKESVVGAIAQTSAKELERTGGVSSLGAALTGNLPGVITTASTGMPGEEDPKIYIRGLSTWNNSDPLVLVDGVERPISSVDINSVESISVLKDASATAIFGVKGGNGVILISTKRGSEGKAKIDVGLNSTLKVPSKLPNKYDSYDALMIRNKVAEYELARNGGAWNYITPQSTIDKYRNPANQEEKERYPNVDWDNALFKDYTMSHNANIDVSGGTKSVKYFTSMDYLHEGDLFKIWNNNRGYTSGYGYDRINVRSNLDFQLTKSTLLKSNLFGSYGVKKSPWGATGNEYAMWQGAYNVAPDVFYPQYSDGVWGYYPADEVGATNSAMNLALSGYQETTTTRINTDFTLQQDLGMFVKGLSFLGTLSADNIYVEKDRGINDLYHDAQLKWINPKTGEVTYKRAYDTSSNFDFQEGVLWSTSAGSMANYATVRNLNYQLQLNFDRKFNKHNVTGMGVFKRQQTAIGSVQPSHREDWVFRTTYNYDDKYFAEYNGSYSGSDMFSSENRFAFFQSGAVGWMITGEEFMKPIKFLDILKVRLSLGQIGSDNMNSTYAYLTQWSYGGTAMMGLLNENSPYTWYRESVVGNPNLQWEVVTKSNLGVDYSILNGLFSGSADFFRDYRTNVLTSARAIPSYYGATAPPANLGKVDSRGFEIELRFNKMFHNGIRVWANASITHATNKIIEADDPQLYTDYLKKAGKTINQSYTYVSTGMYNTWDELYGSTQFNENDDQKIPGNYTIADYNGDGVINSYDNIPYAYASTPQNTYNSTIGFEYKGFSAFAQFYGVNNVTRQVVFTSFSGKLNTVYDQGSYWTKENTNADSPLPRFVTTPGGYYNGNRYFYDGSYIRLKNMEVAYTFNSGWVRKAGMSTLRIYLNGNNLWVWSRMPDDRESNYAGTGWASQGAYPTVKRYNLGIKVTL